MLAIIRLLCTNDPLFFPGKDPAGLQLSFQRMVMFGGFFSVFSKGITVSPIPNPTRQRHQKTNGTNGQHLHSDEGFKPF